MFTLEELTSELENEVLTWGVYVPQWFGGSATAKDAGDPDSIVALSEIFSFKYASYMLNFKIAYIFNLTKFFHYFLL